MKTRGRAHIEVEVVRKRWLARMKVGVEKEYQECIY